MLDIKPSYKREGFEYKIGYHIAYIRKAKKMTQQQLAEKALINYNTLKKVETGKTKNPSYDFVCKIVKYFDIDINIFKEPTTMTTQENCDPFYNLKLWGILRKID